MNSGALVGGKYRLKAQLGAGAMGVVWSATHERLQRDVAIKLILQPNEELRRRLIREARACGALKHPNIVEVIDVDETPEGDPYLVMELLSGETLADLLKQRRRLDAPHAARIARDVAKALVVAHGAGIIHRDLKPANIFLHDPTGHDAPARVTKVLDFGVSKNIGSDASDGLATVTGGVVGSVAYMSPEQVQARRDVEFRCDLWSLGVVLFEMLTGKRPFQGEQAQVLAKIVLEQAPLVSQFVRNADPAIVDIVAQLLERDRERRLPSAAKLVELLTPFCDAVSSRPQLESIASEAPPPRAVPHAVAIVPPSQPGGSNDDDWAATARLEPGMLAPSPAAAKPPRAPLAHLRKTLPLDQPGRVPQPRPPVADSVTAPLPPEPPRPPPMRPVTFGTPPPLPSPDAAHGVTAPLGRQTIKLTPDQASQLASSPFSPPSQAALAPPPLSASGSWPSAPASTPGVVSSTGALLAPQRSSPGTDSHGAALVPAPGFRRRLAVGVALAFLLTCVITVIVLRALLRAPAATAMPSGSELSMVTAPVVPPASAEPATAVAPKPDDTTAPVRAVEDAGAPFASAAPRAAPEPSAPKAPRSGGSPRPADKVPVRKPAKAPVNKNDPPFTPGGI